MAKIILLMCLLLCGCESFNKKPDVVYIPVECAKPAEIIRPELDINSLTPESSPDEVIKAHRLTIQRLLNWGIEEEKILDGYRGKK